METSVFKDILFDLINESEALDIINISWNEEDNLFVVQLSDLSQFVVHLRDVATLTMKERSGLVSLSESVTNFALGDAEQSLDDSLNLSTKSTPVIKLVPPKPES